MGRYTGRAALALTFVMLVVLGCAGQVPPTQTPTGAPTSTVELAALVNGQPITMEEYENQIAQVAAFFTQEGLDLQSAEGRERLSQARRQVLEQMIDQELIRQAASGMGISISQGQLEVSLQEIIDQSGGQGAFEQSLQAMGSGYEEFRQMLLDQLLSEAVYGAVTASISSTAEHVHARYIVASTRERAEEVLAGLEVGEDFAALAREYSEEPTSRELGGDVGFLPRGIMPEEVDDVAFSAGVGEISGVIESQLGFYIIQVLAKEEREIAVELFESLRQEEFMRWLQEQEEGARIERLAE